MTKAFECATEIAAWLGSHALNDDVLIYVDGARYRVDDKGTLILDQQCDVHQYLQYAGDFLSMSFEGPLYDVLNYSFEFPSYEKREAELTNICRKYKKYWELGNAWNLTLADL